MFLFNTLKTRTFCPKGKPSVTAGLFRQWLRTSSMFINTLLSMNIEYLQQPDNNNSDLATPFYCCKLTGN
jgi:hypothetical protein